ncbi:MAG: hypothetical protein IKJ68_10540 [Clostridia bacterium]|nr:hypothetical protein [Clostridia bacterium]
MKKVLIVIAVIIVAAICFLTINTYVLKQEKNKGNGIMIKRTEIYDI